MIIDIKIMRIDFQPKKEIQTITFLFITNNNETYQFYEGLTDYFYEFYKGSIFKVI